MAAAELLADRWSLLILREAFYGVARFDDIQVDLGVPKVTLSDRLKKLAEAGLLAEEPYQNEGQRTRRAYVLTPAARALTLPFMALMQWGDEAVMHRSSALAMTSSTGSAVRVGFIDAEGRAVEPRAVTFTVVKRRTDR
ncbi:helix-turn-helix domain-containing protein [Bosea sp. LjRoot9]|uniref:winged helix-turn-helix transcriptional regulator n=1 Tax=Bosea sp. LjRoot9 TaxID=3342341 RepID=UPI003ED0FA5A